jgi:hypothetical protein
MNDGQACVSAARSGLAFVLAPVISQFRECDWNCYKQTSSKIPDLDNLENSGNTQLDGAIIICTK